MSTSSRASRAASLENAYVSYTWPQFRQWVDEKRSVGDRRSRTADYVKYFIVHPEARYQLDVGIADGASAAARPPTAQFAVHPVTGAHVKVGSAIDQLLRHVFELDGHRGVYKPLVTLEHLYNTATDRIVAESAYSSSVKAKDSAWLRLGRAVISYRPQPVPAAANGSTCQESKHLYVLSTPLAVRDLSATFVTDIIRGAVRQHSLAKPFLMEVKLGMLAYRERPSGNSKDAVAYDYERALIAGVSFDPSVRAGAAVANFWQHVVDRVNLLFHEYPQRVGDRRYKNKVHSVTVTVWQDGGDTASASVTSSPMPTTSVPALSTEDQVPAGGCNLSEAITAEYGSERAKKFRGCQYIAHPHCEDVYLRYRHSLGNNCLLVLLYYAWRTETTTAVRKRWNRQCIYTQCAHDRIHLLAGLPPNEPIGANWLPSLAEHYGVSLSYRSFANNEEDTRYSDYGAHKAWYAAKAGTAIGGRRVLPPPPASLVLTTHAGHYFEVVEYGHKDYALAKKFAPNNADIDLDLLAEHVSVGEPSPLANVHNTDESSSALPGHYLQAGTTLPTDQPQAEAPRRSYGFSAAAKEAALRVERDVRLHCEKATAYLLVDWEADETDRPRRFHLRHNTYHAVFGNDWSDVVQHCREQGIRWLHCLEGAKFDVLEHCRRWAQDVHPEWLSQGAAAGCDRERHRPQPITLNIRRDVASDSAAEFTLRVVDIATWFHSAHSSESLLHTLWADYQRAGDRGRYHSGVLSQLLRMYESGTEMPAPPVDRLRVVQALVSDLVNRTHSTLQLHLFDYDTIGQVADHAVKLSVKCAGGEASIEYMTQNQYELANAAMYGARTYPLKRQFESTEARELLHEVGVVQEADLQWTQSSDTSPNVKLTTYQVQRLSDSGDHLRYVDMVSAYAKAMRDFEFPVGKARIDSYGCGKKMTATLPIGIYRVRFSAPNDIRVPVLFTRAPTKGSAAAGVRGRLLHTLPCDAEDTYVHTDLNQALAVGYKIVILQSLTWSGAERIFQRFVNVVFEQKEQADIEGNTVWRSFCKHVLNAAYGKLCQTTAKDTHKTCQTAAEASAFCQKLAVVSACKANADGTLTVTGRLHAGTMPCNRPVFTPLHLGVFIAGYLRSYTLDLMRILSPDLRRAPFYYISTDAFVLTAEDFDKLAAASYSAIEGDYSNVTPSNDDALGKLRDECRDPVNGVRRGYIINCEFYGPNRWRYRYVTDQGDVMCSHRFSGGTIATDDNRWLNKVKLWHGMTLIDDDWYPHTNAVKHGSHSACQLHAKDHD